MAVDFARQSLDLDGELVDHPREFEVLLVNFKGVHRKFSRDLIRAFRSNQQDRALHCRDARQDEVEQDEGIRVETGIPIERHPRSEENERHENEQP